MVVAVAAITYGTRVAFLLRPRSVPEGALGRFLDVFPLALFVAIAITGLAAPDGDPAVTPALPAPGWCDWGCRVPAQSLGCLGGGDALLLHHQGADRVEQRSREWARSSME